MSFFSINAWAVKIWNGACISNPPPLPGINLKNDAAVKKGKKEASRRSKDKEHFFFRADIKRLTLTRERVWRR